VGKRRKGNEKTRGNRRLRRVEAKKAREKGKTHSVPPVLMPDSSKKIVLKGKGKNLVNFPDRDSGRSKKMTVGGVHGASKPGTLGEDK